MSSKTENSRINKVVESTMQNLRDLIDVNTIIGTPIETKTGETIIPITKVCLGVMMGGGEYGKVSIFKQSSDLPYTAGNGTIISIKPCGFLISNNTEYKILSVSENSYEKIFEKTVDFFENLKEKGDENS